jgi:dienelactone hydrolase
VTRLIAAHGAGDDPRTFCDSYASGAVASQVNELIDDGWIVLAPEFNQVFGSPEALNRIKRAHTYAQANWDVTAVGLLGFSMGGGIMAMALQRRPFPIQVALLVAPAVDFQFAKPPATADGGYVSNAWAAFGVTNAADFATASAEWEPDNQSPWEYAGYRLRVQSSTSDSTISRSAVLAWLNPVAPYLAELSDVATTSGHSAAGHWANPAVTAGWLTTAAEAVPDYSGTPVRVWTGSEWRPVVPIASDGTAWEPTTGTVF